ncbi:hypothetical protein RP20_CCG008016 [Aedes albopictus]|nr:hypothetical protein RP20_CCG008016 [Aedes albopictus]
MPRPLSPSGVDARVLRGHFSSQRNSDHPQMYPNQLIKRGSWKEPISEPSQESRWEPIENRTPICVIRYTFGLSA